MADVLISLHLISAAVALLCANERCCSHSSYLALLINNLVNIYVQLWSGWWSRSVTRIRRSPRHKVVNNVQFNVR